MGSDSLSPNTPEVEGQEVPIGEQHQGVQSELVDEEINTQLNHVGSKSTAEEMFTALTVNHDNKAHQTVNHIQCLLYETKLHDAEAHTIVTLTHIVWSSPQGFNAYVMAQHTWAHG